MTVTIASYMIESSGVTAVYYATNFFEAFPFCHRKLEREVRR